jgi:hypothetical protein
MENDELLSMLGNVYEQGMREALNIPDDWRYMSSRLTNEDYDILINTLGKENVKFISGSNHNGNIRFSIFVGPEGIQNAKNWLVEK